MPDEKPVITTATGRSGGLTRLHAARGVLKVAAALAATVLLLVVTSYVVTPKDNRAEAGEISAYANGFRGLAKDSLDVLFLGDSEAYTTLSPMQMWRQHGFTSYTSGTPLQLVTYSNTLLHRALSSQSPKVVVFETDSFYDRTDVSLALTRTFQDILPILEYHSRWKSLTLADFTTTPTATWTDDNMGFAIRSGVKAADATNYMTPTSDVAEIPSLNRVYIESMVAYCRSKGVTPVFLSTPSTVNWNMSKHNGMVQLASELGVDYLDLNVDDAAKAIGIDWSADSSDGGDHLNFYGAQKVSTYVGAYLEEQYGLADHRGDETVGAVWDASLRQYEKNVTAAGLSEDAS